MKYSEFSMENIIIFFLFFGAVFYLMKIVRNQFSSKNTSGCAKNCGGACGVKIEIPEVHTK